MIRDATNPKDKKEKRGAEIYRGQTETTKAVVTDDTIGRGVQTEPYTLDAVGTFSSPPPTQCVPP